MWWIVALIGLPAAVSFTAVIWITEPHRKFWKEQRRRWRQAAMDRANQFDDIF